MRIKFLIAGLLGLVSATAFAQKNELSNAHDSYNRYEVLRASGINMATSLTSLMSAKTAIDKAAANPKTATLPQTYSLKAAIYATLALRDTVAATSKPLYDAAVEAIKKAKETDTKAENKKINDNTPLLLAQYQLNQGVFAYKQQKYDVAYEAFDRYRLTLPEDTTAIYYTGLSAASMGNFPAAISNYNKLLTKNFSQNNQVYFDLSTIYLQQKDTTAALKIVAAGILKYPTDAELRKREIEISLQSGRQQEVIVKIENAIANDPKNKLLYYYKGLTYGMFAEEAAAKLDKAKAAADKIKASADKTKTAPDKTKNAADKTKNAAVKTDNTKEDPAIAALMVSKTENFAKSAEAYKKAIEIDPNYFEATLNLGYSLIIPAVDTFNAVNNLPMTTTQKDYDAAAAKATAQFEAAKPYLLKAVELNPKSTDALVNFKYYYLGTKNPTEANAVQKKIDDLDAAAKKASPDKK